MNKLQVIGFATFWISWIFEVNINISSRFYDINYQLLLQKFWNILYSFFIYLLNFCQNFIENKFCFSINISQKILYCHFFITYLWIIIKVVTIIKMYWKKNLLKNNSNKTFKSTFYNKWFHILKKCQKRCKLFSNTIAN